MEPFSRQIWALYSLKAKKRIESYYGEPGSEIDFRIPSLLLSPSYTFSFPLISIITFCMLFYHLFIIYPPLYPMHCSLPYFL